MKEMLESLLKGYEEKFAAYLKAANILEKLDEELFMAILKKAAGCKLMIDHTKDQLSKFK